MSLSSEFGDSFRLQCALTTNKRGTTAIENCADSRDLIGSELWLCSTEDAEEDGKQSGGIVTIVNYTDGKCRASKVGRS